MDDKQFLLSVGILEKWHTRTLDAYDNDMVALEKVQDYIKRADTFYTEGVGFYLHGHNGTGKSHLMNCAFKRFILARYKVQVVSFSDLITEFIGGWYDEDVKQKIQRYKKVDFLGIEEIGKEFKSKESALAQTVLDNILRYRVQMNKPTWFTSNKPPTDIAALYTEDIASMMKEVAIPLHVVGEDYRIKISKKIRSL